MSSLVTSRSIDPYAIEAILPSALRNSIHRRIPILQTAVVLATLLNKLRSGANPSERSGTQVLTVREHENTEILSSTCPLVASQLELYELTIASLHVRSIMQRYVR